MSQTEEFLNIDTPENVVFDYEVVGIGTRFIAALIDTLILTIALTIISIAGVLIRVQFTNDSEAADSWLVGILGVISFVVLWGYFIFFELTWNGQSPGKRWVSIRVIRRDVTPVMLFESIIRNLVRIVDFLPVGYGVGIVTMFVHPQSCRLGDLAACTLVVREQEEVQLNSLRERPVNRPLTYSSQSSTVEEQSSPWPIARLDDEDIRLAGEYLQRRHTLTNQNALALTILRRLLTKMEVTDQAVREADAPFVLSSIVDAYRKR